MDKIKHLYVTNVIARNAGVAQQQLTFCMLVENLCPDKKIDVIWSGEDGVWQTLPAFFHSAPRHDQEYWQAQASFDLGPDRSLPGNIRFSLRYQVQGSEYRDDNRGWQYTSEADSGIQLAQDIPAMNFGFASGLQDEQKILPLTIAVNKAVAAEKVTIHWTTDDWKTTSKAPCQFRKDYWDQASGSNARNPNQYGNQIWNTTLKIDQAYRLQYCISIEGSGKVLWDNNFGSNYRLERRPLRVLALNLHCYQEENQDYKFSQIARAIDDLQVDIICLQEVAELWNDGKGDWASNSARIINDRLAAPYHLITDWSHLGFDKYREGVAILSRHPVVRQEAKYVSSSEDPYDIHARKVVMAQIRIPFVGLVNAYSVHLSWLENGFEEQFKKLQAWSGARHSGQVKATLLCGDFNVTACSTGYRLITGSGELEDQYLAAASPAGAESNSRSDDPYWQQKLAEDYRIDYIFMNKPGSLHAVSGRIVFTDQDYGSVSDHNGYLMEFTLK